MARVLVTTSFSLLLVDLNTGEIKPIHRGLGLYYGIATDNFSRYWIAARRRMVSSNCSSEIQSGVILEFDSNLRFIKEIPAPFPLQDMHQIAWRNGTLWITNTRNNCISLFHDGVWDNWYPLIDDINSPTDVHHYNSITFDDDGSVWILAHNHGPSELLYFRGEHRTLSLRIAMGKISHNIWIDQGVLYTLSSAEGAALNSLGETWILGGFPRGVETLSGGSMAIGINEHAPRELRDQTISRIDVFDYNRTIIRSINLDGEGMLLDIKKLNVNY